MLKGLGAPPAGSALDQLLPVGHGVINIYVEDLLRKSLHGATDRQNVNTVGPKGTVAMLPSEGQQDPWTDAVSRPVAGGGPVREHGRSV